MKRTLVFFTAILTLGFANAQKSSSLTSGNYGSIMTIEKKMQRIGYSVLGDTVESNRIKGSREFIKLLVEALKVENSFQYKFDSLPYLAKVYPEDSSFRIFTIQVMLDNYTYVHFGAVQLNRKNIKLIPFKDFSDTFAIPPLTQELTNKNWLGAVYYRCFTKMVKGKPMYFLFGFDQNDILSQKKYIEPMRIINDSLIKFGYPIFQKGKVIAPDQIVFDPHSKKRMKMPGKIKPGKTYHRYMLEYRRGGTASLTYDREKDRILFDHLAPIDNKSYEAGFMKLSDGTYEGFHWKNDNWVWQEFVTVAEKDDNRPIRPVPSPSGSSVQEKQ